MALNYFKVSYRSRGKPSRKTTVQHAQYVVREGAYSGAVTAHADHLTRHERQSLKAEDLIVSGGHLPQWAHGEHGVFWSAVEKYERANGRYCEDWIVSLPRELSQAQNTALATAFVKTTLGEQYPHTWAMHEVTARDGQPQPHMHVMISSRKMDEIERAPEQFFRRYNATHPEQGGTQKDPWFSDRAHVRTVRQLYSDMVNTYLEDAGVSVRLDPRSLETRGLDRKPEVHWGPHATKRQAIVMEEALARRAERAQHREQEYVMAQRYWEDRKRTLGITPDMPHDARMQRIAEASRQVRAREAREDLETYKRRVDALQEQLARITQAHQAEAAYVAHPKRIRTADHQVLINQALRDDDDPGGQLRRRRRMVEREDEKSEKRTRGRTYAHD